MKHNVKITAILLGMFLLTQIIGLLVINAYSPQTQVVFNETTQMYENVTVTHQLPYGMQPPELEPQVSLTSIIISFAIAIAIIFLLMKFRAKNFIRIWFFLVVAIAIALSLNAFISFQYSAYFLFAIGLILAFFKIFRRSFLVHNLTELLIYPGIAAVFVPILGVWSALILLVIISVYDMWAVWHSKVMIKMAKYQMNELKFFAGFFVPYIGKKEKKQLELIKSKYKNKKIPEKAGRVKINLAILGGGDVVFPIITAGVFLRAIGLAPALFVIFGALAGLIFLFTISQKKKFYPAMPFISGGIFIALLLWKVLSLV